MSNYIGGEFTLEHATQEELSEHLYSFYAKECENWMTVREDGDMVGFVLFDIRDNQSMKLHVIEVMYEGSGTATRILKWLFNEFNVDFIEGYSLRSSAYFWRTVGALQQDGSFIPQCIDEDEPDYEEWEGDFVLTRDNFELRCLERGIEL